MHIRAEVLVRIRAAAGLLAVAAFLTVSHRAAALEVQGTLTVEGQVLYPTSIPGMGLDDLRVTVDPEVDATGPGVRCSVVSSTPGVPDAVTGVYAVEAEVLMERGGPQLPGGDCVLGLRVAGWDGVAATAHGFVALAVAADDIQAAATVSPGVMLARASRAAAGLSSDCKRYAKKRLKRRNKCNALILKLGGAAAAEKCKDVEPEPPACDEGNHVEATLEIGHGGNDQQPLLPAGEAVDLEILGAHAKCQARIAKASFKFLTALAARIQSECVKPGADSPDCRSKQAAAARKKLDGIDKCAADPLADDATGRVVPQAGGSCFVCLEGGGGLDAKCLKGCFERELRSLADGLAGDVPICGDGIPQNGEFCDDGNTAAGDGCSALCGVEAP